MKLWDDFLSEVLPYVENCPNPIAKNQIRNAAIEFCQRTAIWKREMDNISITANIHTYDLSIDFSVDESLSALDYAFITETSGETHLSLTTEDTLRISVKNWRKITSTKPQGIMMTDTENCRLYPIPETTITNSLIVGVILKPSRASSQLPAWIYEQWAEAISFGARARLFAMKSRGWFDQTAANNELANFEVAVKDATIRANKGNSRVDMSVKMRPLA